MTKEQKEFIQNFLNSANYYIVPRKIGNRSGLIHLSFRDQDNDEEFAHTIICTYTKNDKPICVLNEDKELWNRAKKVYNKEFITHEELRELKKKNK